EDPVPAVEAGPQLAEHRLLERSGVAADPLHAERRLAAAGEGARGRESPVRSQYFLEHDLVGRVDVVVERDRLPPEAQAPRIARAVRPRDLDRRAALRERDDAARPGP